MFQNKLCRKKIKISFLVSLMQILTTLTQVEAIKEAMVSIANIASTAKDDNFIIYLINLTYNIFIKD